MQFTFLGCGDAFGSGGRFNTCFHLQSDKTDVLIDCGASSLIAMKAGGVDRNKIDTILITHFHGDHAGGLPYFILDAQFSKRCRPLQVIGPPGLQDLCMRLLETAFPGSSKIKQKFDLQFHELQPGQTNRFEAFELRAASVEHGAGPALCFAYRLHIDGKVVAYTGDTQWVDALIEIGANADLLVAEAYYRDKKVPYHLDLETLVSKLPLLTPKKLVLTHMSDDMLQNAAGIPFEMAEDGMMIQL